MQKETSVYGTDDSSRRVDIIFENICISEAFFGERFSIQSWGVVTVYFIASTTVTCSFGLYGEQMLLTIRFTLGVFAGSKQIYHVSFSQQASRLLVDLCSNVHYDSSYLSGRYLWRKNRSYTRTTVNVTTSLCFFIKFSQMRRFAPGPSALFWIYKERINTSLVLRTQNRIEKHPKICRMSLSVMLYSLWLP